jgi:hypothetical protein
MAGISDADKLGMAALIASTDEGQVVNRAKKRSKSPPLPRPRPTKRRKITQADVDSGEVSIGDANDELMIQNQQAARKANGGMIDGAAIRGKTKGKMC